MAATNAQLRLDPFEAAISGEMRRRIMEALSGIEGRHGVKVLFAVESGSRAWGFPSPDSDYDVRFVYARQVDWYLSIHPGRDVVELPIEDELDVSGWDIRKAIALLLKPNPVMLEWLSSPVRYIWDEAACARLMAFSRQVAHHTAGLYHYRHLADSQWRRHVTGKQEVEYKKYFYALRPALAIRWVRVRSRDTPPMNLQELVGGLDLGDDVVAAITRLLEIKRTASEAGTGARMDVIDRLVESELEWAAEARPRTVKMPLADQADDVFRHIVKGNGE